MRYSLASVTRRSLLAGFGKRDDGAGLFLIRSDEQPAKPLDGFVFRQVDRRLCQLVQQPLPVSHVLEQRAAIRLRPSSGAS